jgi:hypothetical protein
MLKRKIILPVVLAAAAGTPYLVMEDSWSTAAKQQLDGFLSDGDSVDPPSSPDGSTIGSAAAEFRSEFLHGSRAEDPRADIPASLTGPPVAHLGEVFRFDISPSWVTARWPRVTTTPAEEGLAGLRVPLVTGTRTDDLAGSLTYYFDRHHRLQRLTFDGYTGDERQLLAVITQHYGLQPEPTLEAAMYVARWNGRPTSVLRIARAPIITHNSPHAQLHVILELNRPNAYFGLSPRLTEILEQDRRASRW